MNEISNMAVRVSTDKDTRVLNWTDPLKLARREKLLLPCPDPSKEAKPVEISPALKLQKLDNGMLIGIKESTTVSLKNGRFDLSKLAHFKRAPGIEDATVNNAPVDCIVQKDLRWDDNLNLQAPRYRVEITTVFPAGQVVLGHEAFAGKYRELPGYELKLNLPIDEIAILRNDEERIEIKRAQQGNQTEILIYAAGINTPEDACIKLAQINTLLEKLAPFKALTTETIEAMTLRTLEADKLEPVKG